ncbi:MAG: ABC transporter ATP-binding protein [Nitrososphaerota archaeon]|nr:ABC transporter ATP-binding protein [Nitrososphaerota archaeon]
MVRVKFDSVSKDYGNVTVVDNSSFEVKDQEFFIILGPSGCGKTTTLNMIAGLEEPTSGNIYFDDQLVNTMAPEKRDVAMVFQTFALYPNLTVHDNIAFPLKLRKMKKELIEEKVAAVGVKLRITHLLEKKPYQLSGGERQRVALARAIVREPRLFLLDEPLSNIDAKLRVHMRAELIALQRELKITTIYVTHDQVEAMTMADRVMVMNHAKISQIGKPLEVFHKPANLFVAGFMGTPPMNFFNAELKNVNSHQVVANEFFTINVDKAMGDRISKSTTGGELIVGVRPQNMQQVTASGDAVFEGEVYAVEPLGIETQVDVKLGDSIYKFVGPAEYKSKMGDKIKVKIDTSNMHLFDRKSEIALI